VCVRGLKTRRAAKPKQEPAGRKRAGGFPSSPCPREQEAQEKTGVILLAAEEQVGNQEGMALGPQIFSEVLQGMTCASGGQLAEALGVYTLRQGGIQFERAHQPQPFDQIQDSLGARNFACGILSLLASSYRS
jgi:hypothetical protein